MRSERMGGGMGGGLLPALGGSARMRPSNDGGTSPLDTLIPVRQHVPRMGGTQNQFPLTRAASINRPRVKKQFINR